MRWFLMVIMSLALAACGSAKTAEVTIDRKPMDVYAALSQSSVGEIGTVLPQLTVQRTSPGELEILYTFPKSADSKEASIHFVLEPQNGGKATAVNTSVDVPSVKIQVKGEFKGLSALKISNEINKIIRQYGATGDAGAAQRTLSTLLGGVALSTNAKLAKKAFDGTLENEVADKMMQDFANAAEDAEPAESDSGDWASGASNVEVTASDTDWGNGKFEDADTQDAEETAAEAAEKAAAAASEAAERTDWNR